MLDTAALEAVLRTGPALIELGIYQGASYIQPIEWLLDDADGNRTPVDLTGCSVRMQIRRRVNSPDVELDLGADGHIRITNAVAGQLLIDIPPDVTAGLGFRTAVHDIEIEFSGGEVLRFARGPVVIDREVTRP